MKKIIIVGGGASGLAAAIEAARHGAEVTILEADRKPGRKLLKTGNGKCNLTNTGSLQNAYRGRNPEFAEKVLSAFTVQETIAFFLHLGIYTVNHNGWVYPYSEQAESVLKALLLEASALNVRIKNQAPVTDIKKNGDEFSVYTQGWEYRCSSVILSCGSAASCNAAEIFPAYRLAEAFGHTLVPLRPALVPLAIQSPSAYSWTGVRVRAGVRLLCDGKEEDYEEGQVQLTDRGISGIPVFGISGKAARFLSEGHKVSAVFDFFPEMEEKAFLAFLKMRIKEHPERTLSDNLTGLFPERLIPDLLKGISGAEEAAERIKHFEVSVRAPLDLSHAQCMSGGIATSEIYPESCESRLIKGLYITGEMLDIDGNCGGFNLQFAWSSGVLAGRAAAGEET